MIYSKIPLAQSVVALCQAKEITHVVISPGSRNAPLTIGFTHNPGIIPYSIVDERSAAFFALGLAQQLRKPVAVVCTSGSALLNYYPAVAEAFYSDIPLVVISADRPVERIDIGDGQTIRQKNVFENHILYSANLHSEAVPGNSVFDKKTAQKNFEARKHNEREINLALNTAIEENGPVHINVPFYEPLYETTDRQQIMPLQILPELESKILFPEKLKTYAGLWNASRRKMVLVGVNQPNALEQELLEKLAKDDSVIVFTEATSNLDHKDFFTRIDTIIGPIEQSANAVEDFRALQPDILLTFGGMVVSKKIKAFLRSHQPRQHWHVDPKKAYNTYFCLNKHFEAEPNTFFRDFLKLTEPVESDYRNNWMRVRENRRKLHEEYLDKIPFSDLKVFKMILGKIPPEYIVHFGNSSAIRYAQLFKLPPTCKIYCNRGTSGIDGSTSTAVGAASLKKFPTVLITGELAFLYDSNGLWNNYIPQNFKIIVINNGGGGIFRILPGNKESEKFEEFIETTHRLDARALCEMYKFSYIRAEEEEDLESLIQPFFQNDEKPSLLEIFTPRKLNDKILLAYFRYISGEN